MVPDRTHACASCATRFRGERCPRCGNEAALDLRSPRERVLLVQALSGVPSAERRDGWLSRGIAGYMHWGIPGVAALVFVGGAASVNLAFGLVVAMFAVGVQALGLVVVGGLLFLAQSAIQSAAERRPRSRTPRKLSPVAGPRPAGYRTLSGTIRAVTPARSPLSHAACAAFRLRGEAPLGAVDDAGGARFALELADGERILVDARQAWIDVPVREAPRVVRPDAELRRFLEERGLAPECGPVRLAEVRLEEGDRVKVSGPLDARADADGYRGQKTTRTIGGPEGILQPLRGPAPPVSDASDA